ncbi:MAG: hypothetical protein WA857_00510 [Candidatus Acidiferrum sp.]
MEIKQVQITQRELQEILELERDVAPKLKRIEELKQGVKALLLARMPVELGRFDAVLIKLPGRHVPWRLGFIEYLGAKLAEEFKKRFPVQMRFDVKVEEHAVLPLWNNGGTTGTGAGAL